MSPAERSAPFGVKPNMRRSTGVLPAVIVLLCALGCGPDTDVAKNVRVQSVSSGWIDEGGVHGTKKLVPTISLTLKNTSGRTLTMLQVNALFRRVGDEDEWGTAFVTVAGSEGVPPAGVAAVTATSPLGYTGSESGTVMLANSQFVDARVDVFAKYGSARWARLGQYRITRQLLAR
jgi:hypothetical protein